MTTPFIIPLPDFAKIYIYDCLIASLEVAMDQDPSDRIATIASLCESGFQSVNAADDVALNCDLASILWKEAR
jgi:hypothetical protein